MNDPQVLQNKAAKIILNRPLYSSATDAVETLKWLNLEQRRFYHPCTYVYKCINGRVDHSMELLANRNIPNYNTRSRDMLGLPLATKNWGKQRVRYHSLKDQNNLDKATRNAPDTVNFKRSIFSSFYIQFFVFQLQLFINFLYSFCTYFYFQVSFILLYIVKFITFNIIQDLF